jgi:hypothetical protein
MASKDKPPVDKVAQAAKGYWVLVFLNVGFGYASYQAPVKMPDDPGPGIYLISAAVFAVFALLIGSRSKVTLQVGIGLMALLVVGAFLVGALPVLALIGLVLTVQAYLEVSNEEEPSSSSEKPAGKTGVVRSARRED